MRGEVYRIRPRQTRGHEESGAHFAIVVLDSALAHLSTWLVVPTSTRAHPYVFRPRVQVPGHGRSVAMCDALTAVDPEQRLGDRVGTMAPADMAAIDEALRGLLNLA